jgi:hypothetical protein
LDAVEVVAATLVGRLLLQRKVAVEVMALRLHQIYYFIFNCWGRIAISSSFFENSSRWHFTSGLRRYPRRFSTSDVNRLIDRRCFIFPVPTTTEIMATDLETKDFVASSAIIVATPLENPLPKIFEKFQSIDLSIFP